MGTFNKLTRTEWTFAILIGGTLGIVLSFIFVAITLPYFIIYLAN